MLPKYSRMVVISEQFFNSALTQVTFLKWNLDGNFADILCEDLRLPMRTMEIMVLWSLQWVPWSPMDLFETLRKNRGSWLNSHHVAENEPRGFIVSAHKNNA